MKVGYVSHQMRNNDDAKRAEYKKEIVCVAVDTLNFDMDNDLDAWASKNGQAVIRPDINKVMKLSAIIDEVDSILIDQAIVVLDNVVRHRAMGKNRR